MSKNRTNNDAGVNLAPKEYKRIVHGDLKKLNKAERNIRRTLKSREHNLKDSKTRVSKLNF